MQHLVGKTVAAVREERKAGYDTYKDMKTWGQTVIVFTDGAEITIGGGFEEDVYDVFDWSDPDWPIDPVTGWPLAPGEEPRTFHFVDEGLVDGVRYVTVLDDGHNPVEYDVPIERAEEQYGRSDA